MDYKALHEKMQSVMKEKGLTARTLGKQCGDDTGDIIKGWLRNGSKPNSSAKVLVDALYVLDMNLADYADFGTIGGRIEFCRLGSGMTKSDLGEKVGVTNSIISYWELRKGEPKLVHLNKMADIFNEMPRDFILNGMPNDIRNGLVDLPQPTVQMSFEEVSPVEDEPVVEPVEAESIVEEAEDLELPATIGQVMSSVEIVKIINDMRDEGTAVLRHDNFLVKIKKVLGENLATEFLGVRINSRGKEQPCYFLPKREAHLMVMSENYKVQAAVYDRMVELEEKLTGGNAEPKVEPKPQSSLIEKFKEASEFIDLTISMLNRLGIEGNQATLGANKVASQETGINILEMIGQSAIVSPVQERYYSPTELAPRTGFNSANKFNSYLEEQGYQVKEVTRKDKWHWTPTEKGKPFSVMLDTDKAHTAGTVQHLRWYASIIEEIEPK